MTKTTTMNMSKIQIIGPADAVAAVQKRIAAEMPGTPHHTPGQILSAYIASQIAKEPAGESTNMEPHFAASAALGKLRHMEDALAGLNPEAVAGLIESADALLDSVTRFQGGNVVGFDQVRAFRSALAALKGGAR